MHPAWCQQHAPAVFQPAAARYVTSRPPPQLNFVRTRLMGQLPALDASVPDIGKLGRELQSWCDREAAARANTGARVARSGASGGTA